MEVFGVVGWRGKEKTALILDLVTFFSDRNIRVSVIRQWVQGDQESAADDDYCYSRCGSVETLVAAPDKWTLLHDVPHETEFDLQAAIDSLEEVDLVLVDGFKAASHKKLLVVHPREKNQLENTQLLLAACPNVEAVVVPEHCPLQTEAPQFQVSDIDAIGQFIAQQTGLAQQAGSQ